MGLPAFQLWRSRFFLFGVIVESALLVVARVSFIENPRGWDQLWYTGLMTLNLGFFLVLCVWAIAQENKFELYAFGAASLLLSGRVAIDWWNGYEKLEMFCVVIGFQVYYFVLGYFVHEVMDRRFYREMGADATLKDMYVTHQRFWSMLKIDLQMVLILLWTVMWYSGMESYNDGLIVGGVMVAGHLVWEVMGYQAIQKEQVTVFRLFLVSGFVSPVFVVAYLLRFLPTPGASSAQHPEVDLDLVFYKVVACAGAQFVLRVCLLVAGWVAHRTFGQGYPAKLEDARKRAKARAEKKQQQKAAVAIITHPPPADMHYVKITATGDL